ncbi:MAG: tetratricopeptide repeat protein [Promethearchaeota archaeon]
MYKHFEPSEQVFVDREEYLEWMDGALKRCKDKPVVLHLRGIGGIGKSSLLDYWTNNIDSTIRLDCQQYSEFYARLNILAKGAVLLGIGLPRFDVLWQIRQRFVEGVEPVREEGREWAKELVTLVPFIGSLASIGSAIKAVGTKVTPKLTGKYSSLGKWLQEVLGKNHVERLLEILWKDPHHAEFLFMDALLEDLNSRKNPDSPLLFLFDHFEYVDSEAAHWRYAGNQITETELWCVFLSSLSNCVGVMASRKAVVEPPEHKIEDSELTELERESCIELLDLRGVRDADLQEKIVSVSGGNPFVIGTLCDMAESSSLSLASVESLRSDTLDEVRLKTWRKLFSEVRDLQELVNRAGLLPYFYRNVMNTIAPTMNIDQWTRMVSLSFMKDRGDETYVMHDLARDLVVAELGDRFPIQTEEVAELLEKAAKEQDDMKLLGLSISVQGLYSPGSALEMVLNITDTQSWRGQFRSAVELLDSINFHGLRERTIISVIKAHHLACLDRVAEAEHLLKEAIDVLEDLAESDPESNRIYLAMCFRIYGYLLKELRRPAEAEAVYEGALKIARDIDPAIVRKNPYVLLLNFHYSSLLVHLHRLNKAADLLQQALDLLEHGMEPGIVTRERVAHLNRLGYVNLHLGRMDEAEACYRDTLETKTEEYNEISSLIDLGDILRLTSRPFEAQHMFRRGLDLVRKWSKREEGVHLVQNLHATYLRHYGLVLRLLGDYTGAETHYGEALERARATVVDEPELNLVWLSMVLNDFGVLYYEMSQYPKAEEHYEEALENYEYLSKDWTDLYEKYVAWALNNYAILLRETGNESKARKFYSRALAISRELAQNYPENIFHSHLLGIVLNNLGVLHRKMNENDEAEEALCEALEVRQELAEKTPGVFLTSMATTLNNLGVLLSSANKLPEAQEVSLKGLEIRRELAKKSPEMHNGRLGFVLSNLGNIYKLSGEISRAEKCYEEALGILEDLAARVPSVYQRYVTIILSNLLLFYEQQGEAEKAESIKMKLEGLGSSIIAGQETWMEEEDTEADAF